MKKYFLMALLASLFLLPSCKKESKTEVKNPIIDAFDYCKAFYCADTATVYGQLVNDGWSMTEETDSSRLYSKLDENAILHRLEIRDEEGAINVVSMTLFDENEDVALINGTAFKDCMTHVGENYTIAGKSLVFKSLMFYLGDTPSMINDYTEALNAVLDAYEGKLAGLLWSDGKGYSLLISKHFDDDENQDCISIVFS